MAIIRYTINDDRGANHCPEVNSPDDELVNQPLPRNFSAEFQNFPQLIKNAILKFKKSNHLNFND